MFASDVMSPGVTSVLPTATLQDAAKLMMHRHISGLPVIDSNGALVGMLTEGDLLRRDELGTTLRRPRWLEFLVSPGRLSEDYSRSHGRRVDEVMSRNVISIVEETPLPDIVDLMNKHHVKRLPVLRDGKVIGIVARADLLRVLGSLLERTPEGPTAPSDDRAIRRAIIAELKSQRWAPTGAMNLTVSNGTVEFWGCIFDDREREALRVVAENVPGVTSVKDHLATIEPYTGVLIYSPDEDETKP